MISFVRRSRRLLAFICAMCAVVPALAQLEPQPTILSLFQAALNQSRVAIDSLLASSHNETRGLFLYDTPEPHEINSAKKFASVLHPHGLTILLVPRFRGVLVPGFDGIILDRNKNIVASFSLKTRSGTNLTNLEKMVTVGYQKMDKYSNPENWARLDFVQNDFKRKSNIINPISVTGNLYYRLQSRINLAAQMANLFVQPGRQNWLLIDAERENFSLEKVRELVSINTSEKSQLLLVLNRDYILTAKDVESVAYQPRSCTGFFTPL